MTTRAEHVRTLVAEFFADGVEPEEIASRVGISVDRVEAILDQLDGVEHLDDADREPAAPAPRPVTESAPIVVGSPARAPAQPKPAAVQAVPDWPPDETTYRPTYLGPVDVPPPTALLAALAASEPSDEMVAEPAEPEPAAAVAAGPSCGEREGTRAGYQWHRRRGEDACEPCKEGNRRAQRKAPTAAPPRTAPNPAAHFIDRPELERPEGAVAHLSLPLAVTALVVVVDALELAYGPDLRLAPADGGLWVLGRAS